jgi:hypothetical protein
MNMTMKLETRNSKLEILLLCVLGLVPSAWADLQVTITPGYVFGTSERADTSKLNRLGNPTATITGTIGGTNASLGAASVLPVHINDALVDGTNLTWRVSPRCIGILDGGVNVTQLSADVAGLGLSGGAGTALQVNVSSNILNIVSDTLTLNVTSNYIIIGTTNDAARMVPFPTGWSYDGTNLTTATTKFTTAQFALSTGQTSTNAHGLGVTPTFVRGVLLCVVNDANTGYTTTDGEIDLNCAMATADYYNAYQVRADATNVYVQRHSEGELFLFKKSAPNAGKPTQVTSEANFRIKVYCAP